VASHVVERARKDSSTLSSSGYNFFLSAEAQAELYRNFLVPKALAAGRKIQQIRSKHDVTRLGSQLERRIVSEGLFVEPDDSSSTLPPESASFVAVLEANVRFGTETGAVFQRHFTKRVKAGALGDRRFDKRAISICEGVSGLSALSCESSVVGLCGNSEMPLFAARQRLLPAFKALVRNINRGYSKLFDESAAPILPAYAPETALVFAEEANRACRHAWNAAVDYLASENLRGILNRVTVTDLARVIAFTLRCDSLTSARWVSVARAMTSNDVETLSKVLQTREPLRRTFSGDANAFRVGEQTLSSRLSSRELIVLQIVLRLFQTARCVSLVHQAAWERETEHGTRSVQSSRFGLLEATFVDQVAELRLLDMNDSLKQARCIYELMCCVEDIRETASTHMLAMRD
jgi:hypothetical protein